MSGAEKSPAGVRAHQGEFLHVDDLGDACVFALEHWHPNVDQCQFMNVGTGLDLTIRGC